MSEEQQEQMTEGSGRKLVYKAVIDSIEPIEGADKIEVVRIKGWRVVVGKGEFKEGEVVLFFETDSALNPWDLRYEFLKERCYKKFMLHGKLFDECLRLRTIRLRGVYSQGLVMKTDLFCEVRNKKVGEDCTVELAVRHYDEVAEKAVRVMEHAKPGNAKGLFPSFLIKSDEERCVAIGTIVDTERGSVPIESINIGDTVTSFNVDSNSKEESVVSGKIVSPSTEKDVWFKITTKSGKTLYITGNSRIWMPVLKCYRRVDELIKGDFLLSDE